MKYSFSVFVFFLFSIVLISSAANVSASDDLVSSKCSTCHSLDKVCKDIGKKDLKGWTRTVKHMQAMGAEINDAQVKEISKTLAESEAGSNSICK